MFETMLSRLKPQAEKIIAEEQAGFRAGRGTTEQTFNLRILCEKYLQHQQDLYHVFIDIKKAFDRVLHAALWTTMKKNSISVNLIIIIIINPLTARVVGAPQMILQPVFFHFSLFSTALWDLPNSRPVHFLMLSSHLFLCPPCLLPPFTVPCKMVLAKHNERET